MSISASTYSLAYRRYITLLLLLVYIFNQADRAVFGFVMEPIKREFGLSDTELGFLAGPAIFLMYALLGVPVARLADRHSRVNIMAIAVSAWSAVVTLSAFVFNFWQFALARLGVGIGEAGFSAVAQSLIADYHPEKARARAISSFMLAIPLGGIVSALLAGWVTEAFGWRAVFLFAGIPGLLLGLVIKATVKEPRKTHASEGAAAGPVKLWEVVSVLWRDRLLFHVAVGTGVANMVYAVMFYAWAPSFFERVHAMQSGEIGNWMALMYGAGGCGGIWLGGWVAGKLSSTRAQLLAIALANAIIAPLLAFLLWVPSRNLALALLMPAYIFMVFSYGPVFSIVLGRCEAGMRATMCALVIFVQQIFGSVIGVQLPGLLSDLASSVMSNQALSLRLAMNVAIPLALWAGAHYWRAASFVKGDLIESTNYERL